MISFEAELERLRPLVGEAAEELVARERREVFSVRAELRVAAWVGAMLLASAAAIVLRKNADRIGPLAIAVVIALAAAACYAWVWRRRAVGAVVDDYVLLLASLLVSSDLAYLEARFDLLGAGWPRHFLLLAVLHGVVAYAYRSRLVLSLSVAALAAWLGVERASLQSYDAFRFAARAYVAAAAVLTWRELHRRAGGRAEFLRVFEHSAAALSLIAGLALSVDDPRLGCAATLVVAAAVIGWGFRARAESFVLYAFIAAVIAFDVWLAYELHREPVLVLLVLLVSLIGAVIALAALHRRFRSASS